MKKKFIYTLSFLTLSMLLASCGGGSTSNTSSPTSEQTSTSEQVTSSDDVISETSSSSEAVVDFSGSGSKDDPYLIHTKTGLDSFASKFAAGEIASESYIELANDIDYEDNEWVPLGDLDKPFDSLFDGKGHTIKNIKISEFNDDFEEYSMYGFFGYTSHADIRNVKFEGFDLSLSVYGKDHVVYVGGLVAYGSNTYIHNVHMSYDNYSIKSLQNGSSGIYAGGIGGFLATESDTSMYYIDLTNSSCTGNIDLDMKNSATTISYAGGIAAVVYTGYFDGIYSISNCYFDGSIESGTYAGGITGHISSLGSIVDCYAKGESLLASDTGGAYAGGITAIADYETAIIDCYSGFNDIRAIKSLSSYKSFAGHIAGYYIAEDYYEGSYYLGSAIHNCYASNATLFADNVVEAENKAEASASLFKDTLKYSTSSWDLSSTYPSLLSSYVPCEVNITLDDNYEDGSSSTYKIDANTYNPELALIIDGAELERSKHSFHGYYYDAEATVAYRFYVPFTKDTTLYAGWSDLTELIGTYTYNCEYYGEVITTGTWAFDENYFYWISPDNAIMQYEYSFDGDNIFIGEAVVGPMGDFVGGYANEIFIYNEDGTIIGYDVNDYSAVYKGTKSSSEVSIPSYEGKGYLGKWYSIDVEVNLYSDGNAKARSYKTSEVYYYGGFKDTNGVIDLSCFGKVSGDFTYDAENDVLYSDSKIFVREEVNATYSTSDSSVLVAITESKTYIIDNGSYVDSYTGSFAEGEKVTISGITYTVSNDTLLKDEDIPSIGGDDNEEEESTATYLGTWTGKVGVADVTIVINEDGTLTYNTLELTYTVEGNVITASDLVITYNENNQSIYVEYYWDGYEALTGTMTNYTPFEEKVDQNKYVGTYKNQHGAILTLDAEGNGSIAIEGGVTRTFKYVVTSTGIEISDWNDPTYEYDVESITVNSNGTIDFEMCYDYSSYYTWTFTKTA